jgi:uncharacterized RDD family membrane protein YckC
MTGPQDPFAKPTSGAPEPGGAPPPGYGAPPSSQPGYGQPPPSGYGAPAGYDQPPGGYGAPASYGPPPGGQPGRPPLAEWGTRVAAFLIDIAVLIPLMLVLAIVSAVVSNVSEVLGVLLGLVGYIGILGFIAWQLAVQGRTGQTIGKKQMKIKLLREQDGQVVGAGLSIGRYFVHIVDAMPFYLGYLWPLWDAKKQTFADKILQTVVVKV